MSDNELIKVEEESFDERQNAQEQTAEHTADTSGSSGIYVTNKGLSGGALVVAILIAIMTFPIWFSVLATAFGLLIGFFGAVAGITIGVGVGGIACVVSGVIVFGVGIVKAVAVPVVGVGFLAVGLLVFGVGCLMIAAAVGVVRLAIWVINGIIKGLNRLFHGRKGAAA